ncbi:T6SS immunity protein Tli4 family protein [Cupriavidus sp. JZ107]
MIANLDLLAAGGVCRVSPQWAEQSDEQAMQLWDAIIDSIRLRPGAA